MKLMRSCVYMFKLVQYFLTGPKHVNYVVALHDVFTKIIIFDRVWCHLIEEKNEFKGDIDKKTSPAYDGIGSHALQKMLMKTDNYSDEDYDGSDDEENDVLASSDTVANALASTEHDE